MKHKTRIFPRTLSVVARSPGRVELGTFIDQQPVATVLNQNGMHTANIAIDVWTTVRLSPIRGQGVRVILGEDESEFEYPLPFSEKFGIVNACCTHFGFSGLQIQCEFEVPSRSGLGGSSSLAVATCGALYLATKEQGTDAFSQEERFKIAKLSVLIENGLFAPTGWQDQLASVFGGVNLFRWRMMEDPPFDRRSLSSEADMEELESRLVIAYSGESRSSADPTEAMMVAFRGKQQSEWLRISQRVLRFFEALLLKDWATAIDAVNAAEADRLRIAPSVSTKAIDELRVLAISVEAGFAIAGAGGGGFVFALCKTSELADLVFSDWQCLLRKNGNDGFAMRPLICREGIHCVRHRFS